MSIKTALLSAGLTIAMSTGVASASPTGTSDVSFVLEMSQPTADIYAQIKDQAAAICAHDIEKGTIAHRLNLTRKCEKRLVEQVVKQVHSIHLNAWLKNPSTARG